MKILANEFVLPFKIGYSCHASHFILTDDGGVFCVYFYGSKEGADDVSIFGSRRSPDGKWSDPVRLTEDDGVPHWNPVLFRRRDGSVILFYKVGKKISDWKTYCKVSRDDCKSWGPAFELVEGDESGGRGPVRNKAIYLSDGSILAPASTEKGEWKCFFDRSFDDGKTFIRSEDIRLPSNIIEKYVNPKSKGIIQPTVWESHHGYHALLRSSEGSIFRTDSADAVNWSTPYAINMPNNNSGIDAACLTDGRIVLACNPVSGNWGSRSPISLYISEDNGISFSHLSHLTTMPGEYSYPALRYENDALHITYTWNRSTVQYFRLSDI